MYEYVAFNPYNSSPEALAVELTKKSADGWEVVNIVPTFDGRYCAFLRRPTSATTSTATSTPFQATAQATTTATSSTAAPAAWYADPSKRFELRYWEEPSGQNMLLAVVSNLPINQWPKTT
jgi:hypothetical protein